MLKVEKPKLRLAVVPNHRDSWGGPHVLELKEAIDKKMCEFAEEFDIEIVSTDAVQFPEKSFSRRHRTVTFPPDVMMADYGDALLVIDYLKKQNVDALFIPFCGFGQEEAVAKVAKEMNLPVLIWGPRDPAPVGTEHRSLDTQCGMFAATKVLQRYGVTFTYIENCRIDEEPFKKGFGEFIATAQIVKAFRHARILQVAVRPQQFLSVMVNEAELLEKFGVELVPITEQQFTGTVETILETRGDEIDELVADIEKTLDMSRLEDKRIVAAVELAYMTLAKQYQCTAIASDCWHMVGGNYGVSPCFIFGDLNDRGIPCACEEDLMAALCSLMAIAATNNKEASFVADLTIRHPENDNCELLWHCGPFAKQLKKPGVDGYIVKGGQGYYPLKEGELTVLRLDGLKGEYSLFCGKGNSIDGPQTNGNYCWLEVDDWVHWEKKFMYGPYIHHVVGVFGDHKAAFQDACRYLGIRYDDAESPIF